MYRNFIILFADFSIDENTGEIRTNRSLIGLARSTPYQFRITATDNGEVRSMAGADFAVYVLESTAVQARLDSRLQLISPPIDFILHVDEVGAYKFLKYCSNL